MAWTLGRFSMLHKAAEGVVTDLRIFTLATLGILTWGLVAWRRDKNTPLTPASTKLPPPSTTAVHLSQKPKPTHLADTEKSQDHANQILSPSLAYSPRLMESSPTSNKSTPALSLNVTDCDTEETQPSPLRSASFNPSSKTQS